MREGGGGKGRCRCGGDPGSQRDWGAFIPKVPQSAEKAKLEDWKAGVGRTEVKLPVPGNGV